MASLLEMIRSKGAKVLLYNGYSVDVEKTGVTINGCDCAAVLTDRQVEEVHRALGAYLRIVKNRSK